MPLFQYIGREHTMVSLVEGEEKVKVVNGEIVESDRNEKIFLANGFQILEEGELENEVKQIESPTEVEEEKQEEKEEEIVESDETIEEQTTEVEEEAIIKTKKNKKR